MRNLLVASCFAILPWSLACSETPVKAPAANRAVAAQVVAAGKSADWPQWRGPNRDGKSTETGLLASWPKGGPTLLWNAREVNKKAKNVGTGYSSLAIANGRIYTLGDRDSAIYTVCLDLETGKVLWSTKIGPGYGDGGPRCTPTVEGGRVYGLTPQGNLACVDGLSGDLLWSKDLKKDFGGHMMSGWNYSESPLIEGDRLICTPGGKDAMMVALDKSSGDLIWKTVAPKNSGAGYASIVVAEAGGKRQYVTLMGPELGIVGVDAETGKFLWNYTKMANGTANIPTPIVQGDLVFTSTAYGAGSALLKLVPDGNGGVTAKEQYFLKGDKLQNHHGGIIMLGDYVYGGHGHNNGMPFCLEWKTGKFAWGPERSAGSGSAGVVYADGHFYFRWDNNVVGLIEATPDGYNLKSDFQLPKETSRPGWQHPVVHQGKLYIRGNDQVLCYDVKK